MSHTIVTDNMIKSIQSVFNRYQIYGYFPKLGFGNTGRISTNADAEGIRKFNQEIVKGLNFRPYYTPIGLFHLIANNTYNLNLGNITLGMEVESDLSRQIELRKRSTSIVYLMTNNVIRQPLICLTGFYSDYATIEICGEERIIRDMLFVDSSLIDFCYRTGEVGVLEKCLEIPLNNIRLVFDPMFHWDNKHIYQLDYIHYGLNAGHAVNRTASAVRNIIKSLRSDENVEDVKVILNEGWAYNRLKKNISNKIFNTNLRLVQRLAVYVSLVIDNKVEESRLRLNLVKRPEDIIYYDVASNRFVITETLAKRLHLLFPDVFAPTMMIVPADELATMVKVTGKVFYLEDKVMPEHGVLYELMHQIREDDNTTLMVLEHLVHNLRLSGTLEKAKDEFDRFFLDTNIQSLDQTIGFAQPRRI